MKLTRHSALDPEFVYNHFINGDFQIDELNNLNLVIMKNEPGFLSNIIEKYFKYNLLVYNVFRVTKNSSTKNLIERQ